MAIIDKDGMHVCLCLDPFSEEPLPEKLLIHRFVISDKPELYFKRIYCNAVIATNDDHVVGHCKCSNCHNTMNPFDKFCSNCGAKSKGRIIIKD